MLVGINLPDCVDEFHSRHVGHLKGCDHDLEWPIGFVNLQGLAAGMMPSISRVIDPDFICSFIASSSAGLCFAWSILRSIMFFLLIVHNEGTSRPFLLE